MALKKSTDSATKPRLTLRNGVWTVSAPPYPFDCTDKARRLIPIRWYRAHDWANDKNQEHRNG